MFDIGFTEMALIGVMALVVVGPERLPKLARTIGLWVGRARRMLGDVKRDIDREINQAELGDFKDIKNTIAEAKSDFQSEVDKIDSATRDVADSIDREASALDDAVKTDTAADAVSDTGITKSASNTDATKTASHSES